MANYGQHHWKPRFAVKDQVVYEKEWHKIIARGPLRKLDTKSKLKHPDEYWHFFEMGYMLERKGEFRTCPYQNEHLLIGLEDLRRDASAN